MLSKCRGMCPERRRYVSVCLRGAHEGIRTLDLILTKNVLCLLSYVGIGIGRYCTHSYSRNTAQAVAAPPGGGRRVRNGTYDPYPRVLRTLPSGC